MKNTIKRLSLIMAICVLFSAFPAMAYTSDALNNLRISGETDLGHPFKTLQLIHCTFTQQDGRDLVFTSATGHPPALIGYDVLSQTVVVNQPLEGAHTVWSHGTDSQGNVYVATQSEARMFKWDPVAKNLTNYGTIEIAGVTQTALYGIAFDSADNAYVGTYPSGYIVRLNATSGQYEPLVAPFPGEQYVRSVVINGDYIYAMGNTSNAGFVRYPLSNITNTHVENLQVFARMLPGNKQERAQGSQGMVAAGDYLICYIGTTITGQTEADSGKAAYFAVYKISTNSWFTNDNMLIPPSGYYASPEYDGKVYMANSSDKKLHAFNLSNETMTNEGHDASGIAIRGAKFFEISGVKTMVTVQQNGYISYTPLTSASSAKVPVGIDPMPLEIRGLARGLSGTNTIAISCYMGTQMGFLNASTDVITYTANQQVEGMGESHGEFYTGSYPGGNLSTIDYANNYARNQIAPIGYEQDRPFMVIEAGAYTAFSSVPDYGKLGGAITLVNPTTKDTEVYKDIITNQSIIGLEYKDGKIYGTTGVWGGLGIEPVANRAKVFIFDMSSKGVTKQAEITLSNVDIVKHIGGIKFAKDGTLWAVSQGVVFKLNPDTLAVEHEIKVNDQRLDTARYIPQRIHWLTDTVMLTTAGDCISAIDITTNETKKISNDSFFMALSENNNLYYVSGGNSLRKVALRLGNDSGMISSEYVFRGKSDAIGDDNIYNFTFGRYSDAFGQPTEIGVKIGNKEYKIRKNSMESVLSSGAFGIGIADPEKLLGETYDVTPYMILNGETVTGEAKQVDNETE